MKIRATAAIFALLAVVASGMLPADAAEDPSQVVIGIATGSSSCQAGSPGAYDAVQGVVPTGAQTYTVPSGLWKVQSWRMYGGQTKGAAQLEVWKPITSIAGSGGTYRLVGISAVVHTTPSQINTFVLAHAIKVSGGDVLGLRQDSAILYCGTLTTGFQWFTNHSGSSAPDPGTKEALTFQADLLLNVQAVLKRT